METFVNSKEKLRIIFLVINGLFWCMSLAVLIYMAYHLNVMPNTIFFLLGHEVVAYISMISGTMAFITGLVGYCTGVRINGRCIKAYIGLVSIFMVLSICLIGVLSYFIDSGEASYRSTFLESGSATVEGYVRGIQVEMQCCGFVSPEDYFNSSATTELPVSTDIDPDLDISCYNKTETIEYDLYVPYENGCQSNLTEYANKIVESLLVASVLILIIQAFGLGVAINILQRLESSPSYEDFSEEEDTSHQRYDLITNAAGGQS